MRALAALVLLSGWVAPALAVDYVRSVDPRTGVCLFWTRREIPWLLNEKGVSEVPPADLRAAIGRSFSTWEDVECSDISFRADGLTARQDIGFDDSRDDNVNLLVFREEHCDDVVPVQDPCRAAGTCADVYGCWDHSGGIIALTFVNYSIQLGVIVDADIEFNAAPDRAGQEFRFTATVAEEPACQSPAEEDCVSTDVENTTTHEIGHLLGFDHALVADMTMFPSAPAGETKKRTLHPADVEGLCDVYPAGERVLTCTPSGTIGITPTGPSDDGCASVAPGLFSLAAVVLGLRRRRRAR